MLNKVLRRQVLFFEDTEAVKKFPPFLQDLIKQFPECKFLLLTYASIYSDLTIVLLQGPSTRMG